MPDKSSQNPSTTSMAYDTMLPRWAKIDCVLAGTESMRAAGEAYLPRHERESDASFSERLHRNVLFNMLEITLDSLVGRPFSDPVDVSDEVPEDMLGLLEDIDLQGNNIDVFGRRWFRNGTAKCFGAVLVEFPRTDDRPGRTLEDDINEGVRPYWVEIPPENIIFASGDMVGGQEVLTHVRFREEVVYRSGFGEAVETRIRVFDRLEPGMPTQIPSEFAAPETLGGVQSRVDGDGVTTLAFEDGRVQVSIYVEDPDKKDDDDDKWRLSDVFFMEIPAIPLVIYYAERDALMLGKPPLLDLADLNIAHWQSGSDQRAVLTVARFPILASSGEIDETQVEVGPGAWLNTKDPQGRWYYVEHTGASIKAGREDMDGLVEQMAEYGAQFLKQRPGNPTATARALDSAESTSPLQDMAVRFDDALNMAWGFTGMWLGREPESIGTLGVNREFGPEEFESGDVAELGQARRTKDLSRRKYLAELQRRGSLPDDFNYDENDSELEEEAAAFTGALLDIDPGGGDDPPQTPPGTPPAGDPGSGDDPGGDGG